MKAMELKSGDTVTRPATERGQPATVTRTVRTVTPLPGTDGVRVVFTDNLTLLYPNDNNV